MAPAPERPLSKLAQAWRALARAFTPTRPRDLSQGFGEADTTLFGPLPEVSETAQKSRFGWQQTGESSYFADSGLQGKDRRRS